MIHLYGTSIYQVSLFFNCAAFMMVLGLLLLSKHLYTGRMGATLYKYLCYSCLLDSFVGILMYLVLGKEIPLPRYAYLIVFVLQEIAIIFLIVTWLLYNYYILYESVDYIIRRAKIVALPAVAVSITCVAIEMWEYGRKVDAAFMAVEFLENTIMVVTGLLYLCLPVILVEKYKKETGKYVNYVMWPMLWPVVIGTVGNVFVPYNVKTLGYAIGLISLYFSMISIWKYEDIGHEYYNHAYLDRVRHYAKRGMKDYSAALCFRVPGDATGLPEIVHREMPKGVELIRYRSQKYVAVLEGKNKGMFKTMHQMIEEAIEEYDMTHTDKPTKAETELLLREKGENALVFVNRVADKMKKEKREA